jgi:hypothetical protein
MSIGIAIWGTAFGIPASAPLLAAGALLSGGIVVGKALFTTAAASSPPVLACVVAAELGFVAGVLATPEGRARVHRVINGHAERIARTVGALRNRVRRATTEAGDDPATE